MPDQPKRFSKLAEELIASFRRLPSREPAGMRKRSTRELGAVVEDLRVKLQLGRPAVEDVIRERWAELVTPAIAGYSHAVRIDAGKRLVVHASHSVALNELSLNRAEIVERIRKLPGCAEIRELRIRAG